MKKTGHMSGRWVLFLIFCLGFSLTSRADTLPLTDPVYQFERNKLNAAENSFLFLRSFVDYFYLLTQANQQNLPAVRELQGVTGWCVGDAHPENFGVVLQQGGDAIFTMNDMDDGGACPVGLDLLRLLVSSRLYQPKLSLPKVTQAYQAGLQGAPYVVPLAVQDLMKKSLKKGVGPNLKKISGRAFLREEDMDEVSATELTQIKKSLSDLPSVGLAKAQILDVVTTSKTGGGSGGMIRYQILVESERKLVHLEMKAQTVPAIYPVAVGPIPKIEQRISKAVSVMQSANPSEYYRGLQLNGREMLLRPQFYGDQGLELHHRSDQEFQEIVNYEAYVLGVIHGRTIADKTEWVSKLKGLQMVALEKDIGLISNHFNAKFLSLK